MTKKVFFLCSSGKVHLCLFSRNVTLGLVTQVDVQHFHPIVGLLGFVLLGLGDRLGFTQSGFWL
jgi:hypothetical protein